MNGRGESAAFEREESGELSGKNLTLPATKNNGKRKTDGPRPPAFSPDSDRFHPVDRPGLHAYQLRRAPLYRGWPIWIYTENDVFLICINKCLFYVWIFLFDSHSST